MIIADERLAVGVLDSLKLEPGLRGKLAAIGDRLFDRGKFEEVVFAFPRAGEQQQYKPNRLHRDSPLINAPVN